MIKFLSFRYKPFLISLCALILFIFIINRYAVFDQDKKEKDLRDNLLELLMSKKSQLEKSLFSRIYYTKGIAAYCSINPDITNEEFHKLANELIRKDSVISSMSVAKDCIINAIYPMEGHESAIGLKLLEHPGRKKIVESTIKTKNTFVAGPVELVEGGIAFISYTPIFSVINGDSKFWGVTDIVVLKDKLFNEIKLTPYTPDFSFAIKGTDGTGLNGRCFWGDSLVFKKNPVLVNIFLPTGSWTLAGVPNKGWDSKDAKNEIIINLLYICAVIISVLIFLQVRSQLKIRENEQELKAIFGAMQDLIIQFNRKGEYVKIAPTNEKLLVKPSKELRGKTLHQVFDKDTADYFMDAIRRCIDNKKMTVLNYPLCINGQKYWFHARITYLNEDSVIYVAQDNTAQRNAEDHLKESRQQLIEMNSAKDKFFSIIAHDLKGPFLGFLGISEELNQNVSEMSREEIAELAGVMHSSAKKTFNLLNNLLEWSRLQTGNMKLQPQEIELKAATELCSYLLESAAVLKSINIINEVDAGLTVNADKNMLDTILRNVISNAIKFSYPGGTIQITSAVENGMARLSVKDNGVGIKDDILEKIFRIDSGVSSKGTNGEQGTGLGLILCKELVEKNNGVIEISSIFGSGTIITISLPLRKNENM